MHSKTPLVLFLVDGLRPEALEAAPMPTLLALQKSATYSVAHSLAPFCTLPRHFSLFHSSPPARHGINTNHYTPPVRPIPGLFEVFARAGKRCGMVYNWEELRDLGRPGSLVASHFEEYNGHTDHLVAEKAIEFLKGRELDFLFCYLNDVDGAGHRCGWMEPGYLEVAHRADALLKKIMDVLPPESPFIVASDHGGHGRGHGVDCPEDKHVPLLIHAPGFEVDLKGRTPTLLDYAPTLATLGGVPIPSDWEGQSLVEAR